MKHKQKILFILGTRPEIIRLSSIIKNLQKYADVKILNTGQNFDPNLNKIFLSQFNIKVDFNFNYKLNNFHEFYGNLLSNLNIVLDNYIPEKIVILGDTNSALVSLVFKKMNIPIYHIEAGNRAFDEKIPEEINRKIIDHYSDYNFVYSERARQNLINEGINTNRIFLIGSPLNEVFRDNFLNIKNSKILKKFNILKNKYFLISFHRNENINDKIVVKKFFELINFLHKEYKLKIIISTHPSFKSKIKNMKLLNKNRNIIFANPFSYFDYCKLQINSFMTLSDSGSISEESKIMKFKAISLRYSIERQEASESGLTPIGGLEISNIDNLITFLSKNKSYNKFIFPSEYNIEDTSIRFINILLGSRFK